jgi:putative transposase
MMPGEVVSQHRGPNAAVKSVVFKYKASPEIDSLFKNFGLMCNEAIEIALRERPISRFNLIELGYSQLMRHGLHSHYVLSACEVAYSAYKNSRAGTTPRVRRAFLKLDNQTYQLNRLLLRIPIAPRRFIFLVLQGAAYQVSYIEDPSLKRGSVTITENTVSLAFTRQTPVFEPTGSMGIDVNERNVTVSGTDGSSSRFIEPGEVADIKVRYREIRAKIASGSRQDNRIAKRLFARYGRREKNRTRQRLHKMTKQIVNHAKENDLGVKMEKLTGIRRLYRRHNGQSASFRGRMNTWMFGEIQRQIEYKSKWEGIPCWFVNPRGTSRNCPDCGSRVAPLPERKLYCAKCDITWDRDVLASRNIMACAVPQARPSRGSYEGERGDDGSNPGADGGKQARRLTAIVKSAEPNSASECQRRK